MKTLFTLVQALAFTLSTALACAQGARSISGKIDEFMIDDHYMVIDGKRLVVNEGDLVITYKGEAVSPSLVSRGLTIFYSTRADGSVSEIVLVGPAARLERLNDH